MNRLAGVFQIDFKRCILIIIGTILFNILIAQPIKLTLELKGAASTGDSFLLDEPIYAILTAKNISSLKQKMLNFKFGESRGEFLKWHLISEDGRIKNYLPGGLHGDNFGFKKPKEENFLLTIAPGDSYVSEIGELLYDYYIDPITLGRYRMKVSWRNVISNEVHFDVVEPKGDLAKAHFLYKRAIHVFDSLNVSRPKSIQDKIKKENMLWERIEILKDIMEKFKNEKVTLEPYFVLTHELLQDAYHHIWGWMIKAADTAKSLEVLELRHAEHKKFVEEHPNTYFAQRVLEWRIIGNSSTWVFPKWETENDTNYISWLQSLTIKYAKTLVGKEAQQIMEKMKEEPKENELYEQ